MWKLCTLALQKKNEARKTINWIILDQNTALFEKKNKKYFTNIKHTEKLALTNFVANIEENEADDTPTFMLVSCQNNLKNEFIQRKLVYAHDDTSTKCPARNSKVQDFSFFEQCIYCEKKCAINKKYPKRVNF